MILSQHAAGNSTHKIKMLKTRNIKKTVILSTFSLLAVINGCALAVIGVGAGIGTFAYYNGKLIRTYKAEYQAAIMASRKTLNDLNIPITEDYGDKINTIIKAERPNGTPITIEIERIEYNLTEISVRSGTVGIWDKNVSKRVHDLIGQKLAQPDVKNVKNKSELKQSNSTNDAESVRKKAIAIIYFNHNSNDLSDGAREKLNQVAKILTENSQWQILASGFSDSSGSAGYNKFISENRAVVVKTYLVAKGVKPHQIIIEGRGAENFLGSNETVEGRKLNRRVELRRLNSE